MVARCQPGFPGSGLLSGRLLLGSSSIGSRSVKGVPSPGSPREAGTPSCMLFLPHLFLPLSLLQPQDSALRPRGQWRGRRNLKGAPLMSWPHFVGQGGSWVAGGLDHNQEGLPQGRGTRVALMGTSATEHLLSAHGVVWGCGPPREHPYPMPHTYVSFGLSSPQPPVCFTVTQPRAGRRRSAHAH